MRTLEGVLLAFLIAASPWISGASDEPDELMPGTVTVVKPGALAKFVAKPMPGGTFALPGAMNDPTVEGGRLRVFDTAGTAGNAGFLLPVQPAPLGWKGLGSPPGSKGFKYKGAGTAADPCKAVVVKDRVVKGICKGSAIALSPPFSGEVGILLTIGSGSKRYCASFGGVPVMNDPAITKRKAASPPGACPIPLCDTLDSDGDGWSTCDGDCCDSTFDCPNPELVNPGAFEVAGNLVDDDCDGTIDNALGACDNGLGSNSSTALDYAKAIDLCQTTVESPPTLAQKTWGVLGADLFRADGAGTPAANSRSIRTAFGSGVFPLGGAALAVLSTGNAATPSQTNPPHVSFQPGQDQGTTSAAPADWLAANGGTLPNAPGCPSASGGTTTNDPIMLKVRVRVPTNARSFSVGMFFYSAEYPEFVCTQFNDFFVALLDSSFLPTLGEVPNPADKNLATYDPLPLGGPVYPVGVNLAYGNTGLFQQCKNGPIGCAGSSPDTATTCIATTQLVATGFDVTNPLGVGPNPGYCGANNLLGGGTGWLVTSGNVMPGETIEVRFVIWDTSDPLNDSVVLLDNWVWSTTPTEPGTHD